jgi:Fic family protein
MHPFTITNAITAALTRIERARGFLEAAQLSEDWLKGMQARALVLEAHYTTHIEGTHLTLDQSGKLLAGEQLTGVDPDDARELLNYRDAFDLVSDYLGSGEPVTEGLIREIHKRLVRGVRGDAAVPGEYRRVQNYIVNSVTREVIYTPPAALEVPRLMGELVGWLGEERGIHPALVAGIGQFELVDIHPFLDGNGRTARLLSTLCLYRSGYDFRRMFTISEYYDRDRPAYYRALQQTREQNLDLTGWLEYFTGGLATQLSELQTRGEGVIRRDVMALRHGLTARQKKAVELAGEKGTFGIRDYEEASPGVTRRTLQRELKELVKKGVLRVEGATRNLSYSLGEGF